MNTETGSVDRYLVLVGLAAVVFAGAGRVRVAIADEGNVVFADDFETPSTQSPPPNWAMWGCPAIQGARQLHTRHGATAWGPGVLPNLSPGANARVCRVRAGPGDSAAARDDLYRFVLGAGREGRQGALPVDRVPEYSAVRGCAGAWGSSRTIAYSSSRNKARPGSCRRRRGPEA